ncbi:MAG TPA: hypothetical protein ACQGQI_05660 [Xylella sp.]
MNALVLGYVQAQSLVHKCSNGRHISYQSEPCVSGMETRTWQPTPDPPPTNAEIWRRYQLDQEMQQRYSSDRAQYISSGSTAVSGASISVHSSSCDAARHQRAIALDKMGVNRSYRDTAYWDDYVNSVCK